MKCCRSDWTGPDELPFVRFLASGFYDGPTEGITECEICSRSFGFRLLSWDKNQDLRVFGFAEIDYSVAEITDRLGLKNDRVMPVTLIPPNTPMDEFFSKMLKKPMTHICAAKSLPGRGLVWRQIREPERMVTDWFSYLHLPAAKPTGSGR